MLGRTLDRHWTGAETRTETSISPLSSSASSQLVNGQQTQKASQQLNFHFLPPWFQTPKEEGRTERQKSSFSCCHLL